MQGGGVVDAVDNSSDRDGGPVWSLMIADDPRNALLRQWIETNRTVVGEWPAHVAVMMDQHRYPVCPIAVGDDIDWRGGRIYCRQTKYGMHGDAYDPEAPLSPP